MVLGLGPEPRSRPGGKGMPFVLEFCKHFPHMSRVGVGGDGMDSGRIYRSKRLRGWGRVRERKSRLIWTRAQHSP